MKFFMQQLNRSAVQCWTIAAKFMQLNIQGLRFFNSNQKGGFGDRMRTNPKEHPKAAREEGVLLDVQAQ
ncbi:hypothetical protein Syun_026231 [Stephania yunnanensis]|uniref:Uncharacterized protein n=1 Tax=Stephania yunnanensis TaxID=152371 RepID=A0AAP0ET41_9MAGN